MTPRPAGSPPRARRRLLLVVLGASLLVVLAVVGAVLVREQNGFVVRHDLSIEAAAHRAVLASPTLLAAARAVTHAGDPLTRWVIAAAVVAYLAWRRSWRLTAFYAGAVLGGLVVVNVIKGAVGRLRPQLDAPVAHAGGPSFPSGHAMGATILYGGLVLLVAPLLARWARWLVIAVAALLVAAIAASRVLLGVHYLSDVVAGCALGLAWLVLTVGVFQTWRQGRGERFVADPLVEGVDPAEQEQLGGRQRTG
ncbi:MAG: phosphatase PAP2 family protein [Frankiaceae bacterium]